MDCPECTREMKREQEETEKGVHTMHLQAAIAGPSGFPKQEGIWSGELRVCFESQMTDIGGNRLSGR